MVSISVNNHREYVGKSGKRKNSNREQIEAKVGLQDIHSTHTYTHIHTHIHTTHTYTHIHTHITYTQHTYTHTYTQHTYTQHTYTHTYTQHTYTQHTYTHKPDIQM